MHESGRRHKLFQPTKFHKTRKHVSEERDPGSAAICARPALWLQKVGVLPRRGSKNGTKTRSRTVGGIGRATWISLDLSVLLCTGVREGASGPREAVKVKGRLNVVLDCWVAVAEPSDGNLLLTFWGLEVQDRDAGVFAVERSLVLIRQCPELRPHVEEGTMELSRASLTRTLKVVRVVKVCPHHLPEAPPPNTVPLGVRISAHEFGGDTDFQSIPTCPMRGRPLQTQPCWQCSDATLGCELGI